MTSNSSLLAPGSAALAALERDFALLDSGRLRADDFMLRLQDARVAATPEAARLLRQLSSGAAVSFQALLRALTSGDGGSGGGGGGAQQTTFGISSEQQRERALAYSTALASNILGHGPTLTARACRNELDARLEAAGAASAPPPAFSSKARQVTPQLQAESGAGALIRGEAPAGAEPAPHYAPHAHAAEPHMSRSALIVTDARDLARPEFPQAHYRASADAASFTRGSTSGSTFFQPHVAPNQRVHGATLQQLAGGCGSALERRGVSAEGDAIAFGDRAHDAPFGSLAVSPRRQQLLAASVPAPRSELQSVEQRRALAAIGPTGIVDGIASQLGRVPLHASRTTRAPAPFATS